MIQHFLQKIVSVTTFLYKRSGVIVCSMEQQRHLLRDVVSASRMVSPRLPPIIMEYERINFTGVAQSGRLTRPAARTLTPRLFIFTSNTTLLTTFNVHSNKLSKRLLKMMWTCDRTASVAWSERGGVREGGEEREGWQVEVTSLNLCC